MGEDVSLARNSSERLKKLKITSVRDDKPYLFISYKSDDWKLAIEEIVFTLQKKYGLRIYYDQDFERHNDSWLKMMEEHMTSPQCVGVLAFFSQSYVRSYATLLEVLTSQRAECDFLDKKEPRPIIPVLLEKAANVKSLCTTTRLNLKYDQNNSDINLPEMTTLKKCIKSFYMPRNHTTPELVKDACAEIHELSEREDLKVRSVITCFEMMAPEIAQNHKIYDGGPFFDRLIDTIKDIDDKRMKAYRDYSVPTVSVFDEGMIDLEDLEIPRTFEAENPAKAEAPAAIQTEPAVIEAEPAAMEAEPAEDLDTDDGSAPEAERAGPRRKSVTGDVRYTLYGVEHVDNQSDMMLRVFGQVLKRHPEYVDTLPEQAGMNCAAKKADIVSPGTKDAKPSYFRVCHEFTFDNGQSVCIGTAYGSMDKMKKIARLMEICGEDRSVFRSEQVELPGAPKGGGRPKIREDTKNAPGRPKKEKNFLD